MTTARNKENALHTLEQGDFDHAWERYGQLVELFPEDPEYAAGFYTAGYWRNRQSAIAETQAGRARGSYLFQEWDRFQKQAEERQFQSCASFRAAMQWVLGSAAGEFRTAFHSESGRNVDAALLSDLAMCLIRIEDYANATDILRYTARLHPANARIQFLLGESLCSSTDPQDRERGLASYRDAFLLDPSAADPTLIASDVASAVFRAAYEDYGHDLERTLLWFPARLSAASFAYGVRSITERDATAWSAEIRRLHESLGQVVEKFREKVKARLAFLLLEVLRYAHRAKDHASIQTAEDLLRSVAPDVHATYKEGRRA